MNEQMNEKRMLGLAKFFEETKPFLDMEGTLYNALCGTVGCIAGHVYNHDHRSCRPGNQRWSTVERYVRKRLGLTKEQSDKLFILENWPKKFRKAYNSRDIDCDNNGMCKVVADRIRHMLATGE
jgi:hypothetical protein